MNGTVSKRLRRIAYEGRGHHPGPVQYGHTKANPTTIIADQHRQKYQRLKGLYLERVFTLDGGVKV
ncbi:MAG: hypothetical protein WC356_04820 [Candidatus Micrarchaeia archaeon]|jgi:hypothetical protein